MLQSRVTSVTASFTLCSALVFLAASHRISAIIGPIDIDVPIPVVMKNNPPLPPPPPPPITETKRIVNTVITPNEDATPTPIPVGPPPIATPTQIVGATWLRRPSAREFDRYYPARAMDREKSGRVVLNCAVNADGTINCKVAHETPEGWGFGLAAVEISKFFKMAPQTVNGEPTSGGVVSVPITFALGG